MRQRLAALMLTGLLVLLALPAATTAAECQFILGFATLKALIDAAEGPDKVGDCLENQRFNPENGDALQQTTGGLLVWRKADNWTAFTDGYRTWINGPHGLQARLNTETFDWEGPATPPASPAPPVEIGAEYTAQCSNGVVVPNPQENPGLVADCAVLLQSRDRLAGSATLNWRADRAIGDWDGVTGGRRVSWLKLHSRELTGTIPPELGALANLTVLNLNNNQLTGPIPPELGALANLRHVNLNNNQLTGPIPPELGNLTNLGGLFLSNNQLTGPIPLELGNLIALSRTDLGGLFLSNNALTGCLPPGLRGFGYNDFESLGLPFCSDVAFPWEEFKAQSRTIGYRELFRNNEQYVYQRFYFRGKIVQVIEREENTYDFRVDVEPDSLDSAIVYLAEYTGQRLLEDDRIEFVGAAAELQRYESIYGQRITIPRVKAVVVRLLGET